MKLSEELTARGFVNQFSAESLGTILDEEKRTVYLGIDPTADSAHLGNLVTWMLLSHLHKGGHKVIFLVGGGTGMIGDPKPDAERVLVESEELKRRVSCLAEQAKNLLGSNEITFVDNLEWLGELGLIAFLRDIGKHFTVNELVKKDAIAKRMEGEVGISYTEFAYPLLQAYDYLELNRRYSCDLQIGGSDQWGNIIAGVDLIRRKEQKTAYALTVPLIVDKATGKKFGKSEGNAVWLDAEKTSPYAFYQFWLNSSDESVVDYLKLFTFLSLEEIASIEQDFANDKSSRLAQKRLAFAVTALVHGEEVAVAAERVSGILFGGATLSGLNDKEKEMLKQNAPTFGEYKGKNVIDVLVESGLASSKREAREFVEGGAVSLNGEKVIDVEKVFSQMDISILKRGKKSLVVLV